MIYQNKTWCIKHLQFTSFGDSHWLYLCRLFCPLVLPNPHSHSSVSPSIIDMLFPFLNRLSVRQAVSISPSILTYTLYFV